MLKLIVITLVPVIQWKIHLVPRRTSSLMWRRYCLIQAASVGLRYENLEFETQMDKDSNVHLSFCKYYSSRHFRYPRPKWRMDLQSSKRSDRSYQDLIHLNGLNNSNRSEYLNWETINYLMFYRQTELRLLHYCDTIQDKSKSYTKTLLSIKIRCRMNFIGSLMKQVWITTK